MVTDQPVDASNAHNAPPPVVSVTFPFGNAGTIALARHVLTNTPELNRVIRRERLINAVRAVAFLAAGWGVLIVLMSRDLNGNPLAASSFLTGIIGILVFMWVVSSGPWMRFRQQVSNHALQRETFSPGTLVTIELGPRGMRWQAANNALEYGWIYFERVDVFEDYVVLYYASMFGGIPIPRSAFPSEEECRRFVEVGQQWLVHTHCDVATRFSTQLNTEGARCGACGYSLANLANARCPECGGHVTSLMLACEKILARPWWKDILHTPKTQHPPSNLPRK